MQVSPTNIALYRWLEPFLDTLKAKGFTVSPDTHIQLIKVLAGKEDKIKDAEILYDYIAPIIAKTGEQRRQLKEEFKKYFYESDVVFNNPGGGKAGPSDDTTHGKNRENLKKLWYVFYTLLALSILGFVYYYIYLRPHPVVAKFQTNFTSIARPVMFDAGPAFDHPEDSIHASYRWDFGDGSVDSSGHSVVYHKYQKPGDYKAALTIKAINKKILVKKSYAIQPFSLCKPQIFLESDAGIELSLGDSAKFYPIYDSAYTPGNENTWLLNGHVKDRNKAELRLRFDSAGLQVVSYIDSNYSELSNCANMQADKPIYIRPPTNISAEILQTGNTIVPPVKMNNWFLLLMGTLITSTLGVYLWNLSKYNARKRQRKMKPEDILSSFAGNKPPYDIPFKNYEDVIDDEPYISKLARNLKRRMPDESSFIDIPITIHETIKADGFIMPHYSFKTRPVEYLVLIDRSSVNSQQVKLFEYLLRRFIKTDLFIEIYYYQGKPEVCKNESFPNGISLSRLFDLYATNVLIIFSEGQKFIKSSYPTLENSVVAITNKWQQRILVTPRPVKDWGYKEEILQEAFEVLPADLEGQLLLFTRQEGLEDNLQEYVQRLRQGYSTQQANFYHASDIETYLDDPFLFQWVCAIAIYPSLNWNVLLAIGDAIQKENYPKDTITYTSLLKIVRIPWMAVGSMPDETRLELLKCLEPANELLARRTMIRLLNEAATKLSENSFVYEKLEMQRITDKFMLYAQNPEDAEHKSYERAYQQFKMLWKSGNIFDYPLTRYLKKEEGANWTTLVGNRTLSKAPVDSSAINDYLQEKTDISQRRRVVWMRAAMVCTLFMLGLLVSLYSFKSRVNSTAIGQALHLTQIDKNYLVPISFGYMANDCFYDNKASADSAVVLLSITDQWSLPVSPGDSVAQAEIPYEYLQEGMARLTVNSNDVQFMLDTILPLQTATVRLQFVGCPVICRNWQQLVNNAVPEKFRGSWYSASLLNGTVDYYEPIHMYQNGINNETVHTIYTCAENKNMLRVIARDMKGQFKGYIMNTRSEEDKLGVSYTGQTFNTLQEAEKGSAKLQTLASYINIEKTSWQTAVARELADSFRGTWTRENSKLEIYNPVIKLNGTSGHFSNVSSKSISGRKIYKAVFIPDDKNQTRPDSMLLYAVPITTTKMIINWQSLDSSANFSEQQNLFYSFTRTDSVANTFRESVLPESLNEIWSAGSNSGMMAINTAKKIMYYSTGDINKYTAYPITHVAVNDQGVYRIQSLTRQGYKVFFLKNIRTQSFELSVCQSLYNQKELGENVNAGLCEPYKTLRVFYPNNPGVIYLPVYSNNLAPTERKKLDEFSKLLQSETYRYLITINPDVSNKWDVQNVAKLLGNLNTSYGSLVKIANRNPFQRSFVQINRLSIPLANVNKSIQQTSPAKEDDAKEIVINSKPNQQYNYINQDRLKQMLEDVVAGNRTEKDFETFFCDGDKTEVEVNGVKTSFLSLFQSLYRSRRVITDVRYESINRYADGSRCIRKLVIRHSPAKAAY